ncbi:hypothetical protein M758_UG149400 [Ceratodon purpureus]|nr:hypothetical protein M758_UG149400 [Ceratodon purpureus]
MRPTPSRRHKSLIPTGIRRCVDNLLREWPGECVAHIMESVLAVFTPICRRYIMAMAQKRRLELKPFR